MKDIEIYFLFTSALSNERIQWISAFLGKPPNHEKHQHEEHQKDYNINASIHLSGDAIYSCIKRGNDDCINDDWINDYTGDIITNSRLKFDFDAWECKLMGIHTHSIHSVFSPFYQISKSLNASPSSFWERLCQDIKEKEPNSTKNSYSTKASPSTLGFLQLESPYMCRSSVYAVRALTAAVTVGLTPEYYAYLDGLHTGHPHQNPSEFENIGQQLQLIQSLCKQKNKEFLMRACARCAKARGYIQQQEINEFTSNEQVIPNFFMCNLNKIIDRFESQHIILSPNCGIISRDDIEKNKKDTIKNNESILQPPSIVIFITHTPYGSEWSFGALSFAIACANHKINTKVIFIEDGVYNLIKGDAMEEIDHVFNILEVIEATNDLDNLHYMYYQPSVERRGITEIIEKDGIHSTNPSHLLMDILDPKDNSANDLRIYLF